MRTITNKIQYTKFFRCKSYVYGLRSTMTNIRFNALWLYIHKELTDNLDLAEVGNEFVSLNDERYQYFVKLTFHEVYALYC